MPQSASSPARVNSRVAPQLPSRDVKQPAEIAVVRAQPQRGVHHAQIEVVVAGVDEHARCRPSAARARRGLGGVHLDAPARGRRRAAATATRARPAIAIGDDDLDVAPARFPPGRGR